MLSSCRSSLGASHRPNHTRKNHPHRLSHVAPAAALPGWAQQLFGGNRRPAPAQGRPEADELLQLLTSQDSNSSSSNGKARSRIDELLNQLLDLEGQLQFEEQLLQGGPWRVSKTDGSYWAQQHTHIAVAQHML